MLFFSRSFRMWCDMTKFIQSSEVSKAIWIHLHSRAIQYVLNNRLVSDQVIWNTYAWMCKNSNASGAYVSDTLCEFNSEADVMIFKICRPLVFFCCLFIKHLIWSNLTILSATKNSVATSGLFNTIRNRNKTTYSVWAYSRQFFIRHVDYIVWINKQCIIQFHYLQIPQKPLSPKDWILKTIQS